MIENLLPAIEKGNAFEVTIDTADLLVNKEEIRRALGYSKNEIPEYYDEMIGRILPQVPGRCSVRAGYRLLAGRRPENRNDGYYVGEMYFATQKIVAARMNGAEQVACFVCTIGPQMETWSRQLTREGDPVLGHLVDTAATVAVESAVDLLHGYLTKKMASLGLHITNRYSPGYCGWSVSEQQLLFSLFPDGFCDVSLSDSSLMSPIKSVSGIIGIGPAAKYSGYSCEQCGNTECTYRAILKTRSRIA